MGKLYIREKQSLTKGGGSKFICALCKKKFDRKDQFNNHHNAAHISKIKKTN